MTPQEAVDLVVMNGITTMDRTTWIQVTGFFFRIEILKQEQRGVCWKWPAGKTYDDAMEEGTATSVELSALECTRILNEVNRRLVQ